jgi:hypothetical protein
MSTLVPTILPDVDTKHSVCCRRRQGSLQPRTETSLSASNLRSSAWSWLCLDRSMLQRNRSKQPHR